MDKQEHIATLCAAGTVGIAAAGLALGTADSKTYTVTPGKRKQPGAYSVKSPVIVQAPLESRRSVSQPVSAVASQPDRSQNSSSTSIFRRKTVRDVRPHTANQSDAADSRGSSLNRSSFLRPQTAGTRPNSERRDTSTSSSWLKRISTVSTLRSTSPSTSIWQQESLPDGTPISQVQPTQNSMSNKLVKRSTSQRALSSDQARRSFLRRPATSHQRTATLRDFSARQAASAADLVTRTAIEDLDGGSTSPPVWRPFFERGYPRKRHSTGGVSDFHPVRTITTPSHGPPTLVLGRSVEPSENSEDHVYRSVSADATVSNSSSNRRRLRRSLASMPQSSQKRYFTDPVVRVNDTVVTGTMTPAIKQSPLSPISHTSTFDIELPQGSPVFTSSPTFVPVRHRFSFRKRQSTVPSDPTTISSDNDTRVFTDDDSMDFQSDSAYDSLATRATVSSHSAMRPSKLDTIFHGVETDENRRPDTNLENMMQKVSLNDLREGGPALSDRSNRKIGMGILGLDAQDVDMELHEEFKPQTPDKSTAMVEDLAVTPAPVRTSPVKAHKHVRRSSADDSEDTDKPHADQYISDPIDDRDDIDWSPKSETQDRSTVAEIPSDRSRTLSNVCSSPPTHPDNGFGSDDDHTQADRRISLFDWSEQHQRNMGDSPFGGEHRPRTVHGKQVNDNKRSRSSGRKGHAPMHLRSQSVPSNRDAQSEPSNLSSSKFSTWGLGHKPVSEEWNEDFEFDDMEEESEGFPELVVTLAEPSNRGSIRVPQSIIDRQASVHLQFGQVQEFMLLVEELKRLRGRGTALDLINNHSKQLWDDAESIIHLATINDDDTEEENDEFTHFTPTAKVPEVDILASVNKGKRLAAPDESKRASAPPRSVPNPATPPHGRPRGESLAQAKNFLHTIHQSRSTTESSPLTIDDQPAKKLPFNTQDLKDLVVRSGVITRALKEIVRKAEGVSVSPTKTPPRLREPAFSQIFTAPDNSPCPPYRHPGLPHSRSAHSYLGGGLETHHNNRDVPNSFTYTATACSS